MCLLLACAQPGLASVPASAITPRAPASVPAQVLKSGQETLVARLLGERPAEKIAGCEVLGAAIESSRVVARYRCPGVNGEVIVELRHKQSAPQEALPAGSVVVLARPPAPAALGQGLAKRIVAERDGLAWHAPTGDKAAAAHIEPPAQLDARDPDAVETRLAPDTEAAYEASMVHVRSGDFGALLRDMMALARRDPHGLIIGRLVVACAGVADGEGARERVDQLMANAEAHPDDALQQLVAGVAVHYRGHHTGATIAAKMADYRLALRYLGRTNHRFDHSARYWLYTAVSHARLGEQAAGDAAIIKAIAADLGTDADVYYCRAEIFHRRNPAQAVADIKRYRAMMAANKRKDGFSAPEKEQRVGDMQARLERVVAGEALAEDERLFDPLHVAGQRPVAPILLVGAVLVMAGLVLWRRRRRRGRG